MCNHRLRDYRLPVPSSINKTLVTSAYADDITVFITKDEGFPHLLQTFMAYSTQSGATLSVQKSTGLFASRWKSRADHPVGFQWDRQGEKYLGVYFGNLTAWQQQHWTQLEIKIRTI
jgi:hypothetical protein